MVPNGALRPKAVAFRQGNVCAQATRSSKGRAGACRMRRAARDCDTRSGCDCSGIHLVMYGVILSNGTPGLEPCTDAGVATRCPNPKKRAYPLRHQLLPWLEAGQGPDLQEHCPLEGTKTDPRPSFSPPLCVRDLVSCVSRWADLTGGRMPRGILASIRQRASPENFRRRETRLCIARQILR